MAVFQLQIPFPWVFVVFGFLFIFIFNFYVLVGLVCFIICSSDWFLTLNLHLKFPKFWDCRWLPLHQALLQVYLERVVHVAVRTLPLVLFLRNHLFFEIGSFTETQGFFPVSYHGWLTESSKDPLFSVSLWHWDYQCGD